MKQRISKRDNGDPYLEVLVASIVKAVIFTNIKDVDFMMATTYPATPSSILFSSWWKALSSVIKEIKQKSDNWNS